MGYEWIYLGLSNMARWEAPEQHGDFKWGNH